MKRATLIVSAGLFFLSAYSLEFSGSTLSPITIPTTSDTGLENIYVLSETEGVKATYPTSSPGDVRWYRFNSLGGAYSEPIQSVSVSGGSQITLSGGDMGYIVEANGRQHCYWIVDYGKQRYSASALTESEESDCSSLRLNFTGNASPITYYTINGRPVVLSREIELEYDQLEYDQENFSYNRTSHTQILESIHGGFNVSAPLCQTEYRLSGDRFLRQWDEEISIISGNVSPTAVAVQTKATQTPHEADNEQGSSQDGLGGSAPCEIRFEGLVTDAAIFHEWQVSRTADFDIVDNSYSDLDITLTFREQGTTYVRFTAANSDGSCTAEGETYEIFIGESKLDIPNAFSPQGSPGVNDEWKVSYKSLVSFQCNIFNRSGQQLFSTSDPSQGWDGKYRGRFVPAGVYYYVIQAEGADGIHYNKAGDINIIGFSEGTHSAGTEEQP